MKKEEQLENEQVRSKLVHGGGAKHHGGSAQDGYDEVDYSDPSLGLSPDSAAKPSMSFCGMRLVKGDVLTDKDRKRHSVVAGKATILPVGETKDLV